MRNRVAEWVLRRRPVLQEEYFSSDLRHVIRKYGPDSEQALTARQKYAVALHESGEKEKALAEFSAVIDIRRAGGLDADDALLWGAEIGHANTQFALERFSEAERECRELSEKYDRVLGPDHPHALGAHETHAAALFRLGRSREAEAEMAAMVRRRTAARGSDDPGTLSARTAHAMYLDDLGRYDESEAEWGELAEIRGRLQGPTHANALLPREKHANALYKLGRRQEAAAEYGELAAHYMGAFGPGHPDTQRTCDWRTRILREMNSGNGDSA